MTHYEEELEIRVKALEKSLASIEDIKDQTEKNFSFIQRRLAAIESGKKTPQCSCGDDGEPCEACRSCCEMCGQSLPGMRPVNAVTIGDLEPGDAVSLSIFNGLKGAPETKVTCPTCQESTAYTGGSGSDPIAIVCHSPKCGAITYPPGVKRPDWMIDRDNRLRSRWDKKGKMP